MYDMDNDGVISKDELCAFLTLMIGGNISNEQVRHFASIVSYLLNIFLLLQYFFKMPNIWLQSFLYKVMLFDLQNFFLFQSSDLNGMLCKDR
jgi:hypothetical protein